MKKQIKLNQNFKTNIKDKMLNKLYFLKKVLNKHLDLIFKQNKLIKLIKS